MGRAVHQKDRAGFGAARHQRREDHRVAVGQTVDHKVQALFAAERDLLDRELCDWKLLNLLRHSAPHTKGKRCITKLSSRHRRAGYGR
jgi:hypothetical protein